ncbi:hypothetical protein [Aureispira anguillae]|uniref:Uncharacterized protein n=1 Tax=Aureispira anguillae TaxID=2864201 RepID=A0A915YIH9_9BACT|nr:hypothetical protein [Aureispira anguillae]BDS13680.1 hypothetical protein AsAng_0044210 [Aureispira anguillae]
MSFKLKKKIPEILAMDFESYAKFLKKEIQRAAKFGELDAVICGNHSFSDGKESALILMGVYVGDLANFFKQNKAEMHFAKGKCFFESTEQGIKMHIAINAGKGKPDKITKAGKRLWSKAAITPEFHKDKLPFLDAALDQVNVGEAELLKVADSENDHQAIKLVKNNYLKAKKALQDRVVPLISNKDTLDSAYTVQHFNIAKIALKNGASFLNKLEEVDKKTKVAYQKDATTALADYPKLKRIAAKIKQALMASNAVDIELNKTMDHTAQEKGIKTALDLLEKEFETLRHLETQAKEALKYLDTLLQ